MNRLSCFFFSKIIFISYLPE